MTDKYRNQMVTNRKSPKNEQDYIAAYKETIPASKKADRYDISAVRTKKGESAHAMLPQAINRSKDDKTHVGRQVVPDKDLRKKINKK